MARERRRRDRDGARRPNPADEISPAARELARLFGDAARSADLTMSLVAHGAPLFTVSPAVARAALTRPYEPRPGDPPLRALRVIAEPRGRHDGVPGGSGSPLVATVRIPWEPLQPGPTGGMVAVTVPLAGDAPVDLEAPQPVAYAGFAPIPDDARYAAQLCYAAAAGTWHRWRRAIGRDPVWGFEGDGTAPRRLVIVADSSGGARYDAEAGEICAEGDERGRAPAHDDVARATACAVLHGLRPYLAAPCNADAPALRDALAELSAELQRASWPEMARAALSAALADDHLPNASRALPDVAARLVAALRPADAQGYAAQGYEARVPRAARAALLVAAVWEAFAVVWARRVAPTVRIAGGGEHVPAGVPGDALLEALAGVAGATASHLLTICLRAVDYLPPVDATFGDWLRAAVTADRELVPDDRWRYRESLVAACERRGIAPHHAGVADTEALAWPAPARATPVLRGLDFAMMQFAGDPAHAPEAEELERQATVLGRMVAHPQFCEWFGLADPSRPDHRTRLAGDEVSLPCVESVRATRRVGPGGRIVFEVVAEVTQRRILRGGDGPPLEVMGGATVIAGPTGEVRWIVARSLLDEERLARLRAWATGEGARWLTPGDDGVLRAVVEEASVAEEAW